MAQRQSIIGLRWGSVAFDGITLQALSEAQAKAKSTAVAAAVEARSGAGEVPFTGATVWESSVVLSSYLHTALPREWWAGRSVLELGAGSGLAGMTAAACGARRVVLTDQVTYLLRANLDHNFGAAEPAGVCWRTPHGGEATVRQLAWGDSAQAAECGGPHDVILGADLMYERSSWASLPPTLAALSRPGTVVLWALQRRDSDDATFFDNVASAGFTVDEITADARDVLPGTTRALLAAAGRRPTDGRGPEEEEEFDVEQEERASFSDGISLFRMVRRDDEGAGKAPPRIIGVTGVSRSGKGTLAASLVAHLQATHGLAAVTVCQDDFARPERVAELVASGRAKSSAQGWEMTDATDFESVTEYVTSLAAAGVVVVVSVKMIADVWAALRRQPHQQQILILAGQVEGFRALAHQPLTARMTLRLWLEISADTCRERRAADIGHVRMGHPSRPESATLAHSSKLFLRRHQGPVTPETFREALWPRHLEYKRAVSPDASPDVHVLDGEQTPDAILVRSSESGPEPGPSQRLALRPGAGTVGGWCRGLGRGRGPGRRARRE